MVCEGKSAAHVPVRDSAGREPVGSYHYCNINARSASIAVSVCPMCMGWLLAIRDL